MTSANGRRFEGLDVLRGLAATTVVVSHYSTHCVRFFGKAPFGLDLHTVYGFYAVQLFFVISGFVISLTLERSVRWWDFAFARVSRLYPAYWSALTVMVFVVTVLGGRFWLSGYLINLTMLQEFVGFPNLDTVFWSLTVEVAFYVVMGILFAVGLLSRIEPIGAAWLALACLWSLLEQRLSLGVPEVIARVLILRHVPYFVAGITLYRVVRLGWTPWRLALLVAALVAAGWVDGLGDQEVPSVAWTDVVRRLGIAAIIFVAVGAAVSGKLWFASSPVLLWLGGISYSLYVSHRNLGYATMGRLHEAGLPVWLLFSMTLVGALVLATALTVLVERPSQRALRRWWAGVRTRGTSR